VTRLLDSRRGYIIKDEIRQRMRKERKVWSIKELEAKGDIIITTSSEWYFPD
jgi:hypothetical protein